MSRANSKALIVSSKAEPEAFRMSLPVSKAKILYVMARPSGPKRRPAQHQQGNSERMNSSFGRNESVTAPLGRPTVKTSGSASAAHFLGLKANRYGSRAAKVRAQGFCVAFCVAEAAVA